MKKKFRGMERLQNFSDRSFERVLHVLSDGIDEGLLLIQDGKIIFLSEASKAILGLKKDLRGCPEDVFPAGSPLLDLFEGQNKNDSTGRELCITTPEGAVVDLRARCRSVEWDSRLAALYFLEDITRRKEVERRLMVQRETNAAITNILGRILTPPISLDEVVETVLDSAVKLTACDSGIMTLSESGGQVFLVKCHKTGCDDCVLPEALKELKSSSAMMKQRYPGRGEGAFYYNGEIPLNGRCPQKASIRSILTAEVENEGSLSGRIILADADKTFHEWDLESIENIVEALNQALVQQQRMDELESIREKAENEAEARSLYLANVSHEIRSPLNGVLMMASMLHETDITPEQKDLLDVVMYSAQTIDRLIRDLTDLTQIRTGKITIFAEEFDLDELCRHIVETNRPEARRKGLNLDYSVAPDVIHYVADRERVSQIMANLVVNAIKYTNRGYVRLDAAAEGEELRIDVTDTGMGISRDQQKEVFGIFNQGSSVGADRPEGTGIGLAVVKELTEVMNGQVHLESRPGEGSRFTVFLPLHSPEGTREYTNKDTVADLEPVSGRILVAEDEGVNRLYLRTVLEREGWEIDEAVDGVEAVALAREGAYDLVLMDINMPRMDGLEAASRIRRIHSLLPIIAVTAHAFDEDRKRILDAGLNDIILKPIDEKRLTHRLRRYIRTA